MEQNPVSINFRQCIDPREVLMLKGNANYTEFHFLDGSKKIIARTLKLLVPVFTPLNFYRINKSEMINMDCVVWISTEKDLIQLLNNQSITVSRRRVNGFKDFLLVKTLI